MFPSSEADRASAGHIFARLVSALWISPRPTANRCNCSGETRRMVCPAPRRRRPSAASAVLTGSEGSLDPDSRPRSDSFCGRADDRFASDLNAGPCLVPHIPLLSCVPENITASSSGRQGKPGRQNRGEHHPRSLHRRFVAPVERIVDPGTRPVGADLRKSGDTANPRTSRRERSGDDERSKKMFVLTSLPRYATVLTLCTDGSRSRSVEKPHRSNALTIRAPLSSAE